MSVRSDSHGSSLPLRTIDLRRPAGGEARGATPPVRGVYGEPAAPAASCLNVSAMTARV